MTPAFIPDSARHRVIHGPGNRAISDSLALQPTLPSLAPFASAEGAFARLPRSARWSSAFVVHRFPTRGRTTPRGAPQTPRRAFTLIELLVVISIVGILMGLLLPALGSARRHAANTRELSAIRQLTSAYLTYADDAKGKLLPGYLRAVWSSPTDRRWFPVWETGDTADDNQRLSGSVIRPYTWRLLPYVNYAWDAVVLDRTLLSDIRSLPSAPAGQNGFQWALAFNPSFGLNTTYVGGDAHRGAFYRPSTRRWGPYYIKRLDQPLFPDRLLVFATARGDRPSGTRQVLPGNHRIEGPWHASPTSDSVPSFVPWQAPIGRYNPDLSPATYGHVDFRAGGRAITSMIDGHAETLGIEQVSDMRHWSNQARSPDWSP